MSRHVTGVAIIVFVFSGAGCSPDGGMSGGSGGSGGGSILMVPTCFRGCAVASDCVIMGTGEAFDADNYACNAGICEWTGCKSDSECASSSPDQQNFLCRKLSPDYPATCIRGCQMADDCIMSGNPLLDVCPRVLRRHRLQLGRRVHCVLSEWQLRLSLRFSHLDP